MSTHQIYAVHARTDEDPERSSQLSERLLNDAILRADISCGFEEYLDIFDRFCADEIFVIS